MLKKWKWHRVLIVFFTIFFMYKFLAFMDVVHLNYTLGSPLDFSELMSEKDPKKFLQDFIDFKSKFIPFNFQQIAIENEQLIKSKRKEFIRQTKTEYVSTLK